MRNFLLVVAFSLLTVGFFAGYSNWGIPQIQPAPPPEEEKLDLGAMTMDSFVALGARLFKGKGTCTLCHNAVGGRAPLLEKAAVVAKTRLKDAGYKGKAEDAAGYLYESMLEPSAYVVAGFGKAGTGDKVSPMPKVDAGSIGFSEAETRSVIAYLQTLAGVEVTVEIPKDVPADAAKEEEEGEPRAPFKTPEEALAEFSCGACHKVAAEEGDQGPDLRKIGALRGKDNLRRSILNPNAEISKGFKPDLMPADYGAQMYAVELEMLVDYLAGLK
ncbi:MAG: c-type cytochrome [Alphaproteobacteria bacterium]